MFCAIPWLLGVHHERRIQYSSQETSQLLLRTGQDLKCRTSGEHCRTCVLRQLRHPLKTLLSIAPPQWQSRNAERTVSRRNCRILCGTSKKCGLRRAVLWSGFAKIRSAKLNQHPRLPSRKAASLCYIQTYTTRSVYDRTLTTFI